MAGEAHRWGAVGKDLVFTRQRHTRMTSLELRSRLHALIDSLKSEELLQRVHDLLADSGEGKGEGVWATLSETERERVLKAYSTAMDSRKLSSTEEVIARRG